MCTCDDRNIDYKKLDKEMREMTEKEAALSYQEGVWLGAVKDAEQSVMRVTPSLAGGKEPTETTEQYAERGIAAVREALARLALARKEHAAAQKAAPKKRK